MCLRRPSLDTVRKDSRARSQRCHPAADVEIGLAQRAPLLMLGRMPKNDDVARSEEIDADRAQETWDGEGGRGTPRADDAGARESPPGHAPPASRRVAERRRGARRR